MQTVQQMGPMGPTTDNEWASHSYVELPIRGTYFCPTGTLLKGTHLCPHFPTDTSCCFLPGSCWSFLSQMFFSLYPVWPTHPISKSCILFKATSVASAIPMDLAFLWASLEQVVWPSCLSLPRILLVLKHKVPHPRNSLSAEQTQPVGHHKRGVGQALKGRWWLV